MAETPREPDRFETATDALERIARAFEANPTAQHSGAAVASILRYLAHEAPAAAPAAETCPEPPPGWETITTGPTAGCGNIATYREPAPAQRAEAPDPERDRNRHNAMLVEAWRGEFGALCKALFPGHTGMIGWKHIHAKIADREALLRECEEALELEGYGSDPDGLIARIRAARTSKPGAVEGT